MLKDIKMGEDRERGKEIWNERLVSEWERERKGGSEEALKWNIGLSERGERQREGGRERRRDLKWKIRLSEKEGERESFEWKIWLSEKERERGRESFEWNIRLSGKEGGERERGLWNGRLG